MVKCGGCGKFLKPVDGASCNHCSRAYHKGCLGLSDSDVVEQGWKCPECERARPRGDNSDTPVRTSNTSSRGLPPPTTPTTAMEEDSTSVISMLRREFAEQKREFREFREEFRAEFRSFQTEVQDRFKALENRLAAVEQRESAAALDQIAELNKTVALLKSQINERDQEALLSDLDIGHIPEQAGENVLHTVSVLAAKLGVTLQEKDIVFAERVGRADHNNASAEAAAGRPRRVVVRLARRSLRDEMLRAARVRRSLTYSEEGQAGPPRRVFVNERLTKTNRQLFHSAREESRKREWRYCWTRQGRIYVRKSDGQQVYQLRTTDDINRVFGINTV